MANTYPFKEGDIVYLKSSSFPMVIKDLYTNEANCMWQADAGLPAFFHTLPLACLSPHPVFSPDWFFETVKKLRDLDLEPRWERCIEEVTRVLDHFDDFDADQEAIFVPVHRATGNAIAEADQGATGPRPVKISGRDELRMALLIWQDDPETSKADKSLADDLLDLISNHDSGEIGLNARRSKLLIGLLREQGTNLLELHDRCEDFYRFYRELCSIILPLTEAYLPSGEAHTFLIPPSSSTSEGAEE